MTAYDEDLSQNKFFLALQGNCPELYELAAGNRWVICIPRAGSVGKYICTEEDFSNHILVPIGAKPGFFKTASDKELSIQHNVITTGAGFQEIRTVPVLFEETYFNQNDESFRILCINNPLEGDIDASTEEPEAVRLVTLEDCIQLLWGKSGNKRSQKLVDDAVDMFNKSIDRLEGESLRHHVDAANTLFTKAMQFVLKDTQLKRLSRHNKTLMDSLKLGVETYIMHGVYKKLFKSLSACLSTKDAPLNKITRNLSAAGLQLRDLAVRQEFCQNVPRARKELSNLPRYSTPLGKLNCVRRVVMTLMQPPRMARADSPQTPLTTDDLLPILIFMVVKAEIPNWWANLIFMNNFRFSKSSNDDEYGYYVASLEAAIRHVAGGQLSNIHLGVDGPNKVQLSPISGSPQWGRQDSGESTLHSLFQCIRENKVREAEKLLNAEKQDLSSMKARLCHPLCSCDKCMHVLERNSMDAETVTAFSRDDRGHTVLHVAAMNGHPEMTDMLMQHGAVINATDYQGLSPLHLACQRGHQAVTLLLLHHKAKVNMKDNDGNTPLHLAVANGHEECVKAMIYYDQGATALDMNAQNEFGDTPLHLASRWGYVGIIEALLENGAFPEVRNKKKQSPLLVAPNVKVTKMLTAAIAREREGKESNMKQSQSMPINLSSELHNGSSSLTSSKSTFVIVSHPENKRKPAPVVTPVEKLLRAVADGDQAMVCHHLGWSDDLDLEEENVDVSQKKLCHPLCQCSKCQPLQKVTRVSSSGLHVNSCDRDHMTPLHVASAQGHTHLVELLLKRGATINARSKTQQATSLVLACQRNKYQAALMLLEKGAKTQLKDSEGNTALHYCCSTGNLQLTGLLLKYGAPVNLQNSYGNSPLHLACTGSYSKVVKALLDYGASTSVRNRQRLTPTLVATSEEIVILLEEAEVSHSPVQVAMTTKTGSPPHSTQQGELKHGTSIRDLFAALEDRDAQKHEQLTASIQQFNRQRALKPTITRDRSLPRLDNLLLHHIAIRNFDRSKLRHIGTEDDTQDTEHSCIKFDWDRFAEEPEPQVIYSPVASPTSQGENQHRDLLTPREPKQKLTASQELLEWKKLSEQPSKETSAETQKPVQNVSLNPDSPGPDHKGNHGDSELASENSNTESHEDWASENIENAGAPSQAVN